MEDKILDFVNYITNIKWKVTSERIFLHMKKDDESVSQVEIQGTIDALVSINWLEERDFGIKSYLIPSNADTDLAP